MSTVITREQGYAGFSPEIVRIVTTSTLVQVTTAGWFNNSPISGESISNVDQCQICYAYGTSSQNTAIFSVSISAKGVVTLSLSESSVILPTIANHIATYTNTTGTLSKDPAIAISGGSIQAGLSGTAGTFISYPAAALNGKFIFSAVGNSGNFTATFSDTSALGQNTVYTLPDPGAATANVLLDTGTNGSGTFTTLNAINLKYGATPVAQVDPASCTITAAAGASNTATVTIQLKDGSGTNMTRSILFRVYSSSAADGLTLQSAASTGYSVASGGLSLANASAVTTQITAMSSATGGCVISLLDTGKQTSYLVLVLPNGNKISAQLSAGSYG